MTGSPPDFAERSPAVSRWRAPIDKGGGLIGAVIDAIAPPLRIDGRAIYLRRPRRGDWARWARLRAESRQFLAPWEPTWGPDHLTRGAYLRRLRTQRRDRSVLPLLLWRKSDNALLGGLALTNIRGGFAQTATLGYWMGEAFSGHGYMTDAVEAAIPFAFDHLGLHRIEAACLPSNEASRRLLINSGFRLEGEAEAYLKIAGKWRDHLLFALTREDPRTAPRYRETSDVD